MSASPDERAARTSAAHACEGPAGGTCLQIVLEEPEANIALGRDPQNANLRKAESRELDIMWLLLHWKVE